MKIFKIIKYLLILAVFMMIYFAALFSDSKGPIIAVIIGALLIKGWLIWKVVK